MSENSGQYEPLGRNYLSDGFRRVAAFVANALTLFTAKAVFNGFSNHVMDDRRFGGGSQRSSDRGVPDPDTEPS